jgi:caa(3)-type oxidase subunit IV
MSSSMLVKGPKPHTHSVLLYWSVFFALIILTWATVELAHHDFGKLNLVITLLVASTKALLVLTIFMHLAFDNKFLVVVFATSLVFLALFIIFPILDLETRADLDSQQANFLPRDQQVYKYELEHPGALPLRPKLETPQADKLIFIGPGEH